MGDEVSILWMAILTVAVTIVMTTLLTCYICMFRKLCCRDGMLLKRKRGARRKPLRECDELNKQKSDAIPMNDITQGDSMPTESEQV